MGEPRRVQACVLRSLGRLEVEEVLLDPPGPGEVQVRVAAAGVCHSDVHLIDGHLGHHHLPTVPGHEGAGVIEELGEGIGHLRVGDSVAFCFVPACGECAACQDGHPNRCIPGALNAFRGVMTDGSSRLRSADGTPLGQFLSVACFAERSVMPAAAAVPIPTSLPFWQAALVGGAVVTGVGAVRNAARVEACQAVCVVGCGGVGLQVIAGARLAGADPIIAIDLAPGKLELAEARGATQFVDGAEGDVARAVRGISSGVDHAFEVVGRPETVSLAWNTVKPGGTATVVGVVPDGVDVAIDARGLLAEQSLRGLFYGSGHPAREIADLADLIDRGGFDVESTISHATNLLGVGAALERMRHSDGARTIVVIDEELVGPLPERLRV